MTVGFTVIDGYPVFDAFYMTLTTMTTVGSRYTWSRRHHEPAHAALRPDCRGHRHHAHHRDGRLHRHRRIPSLRCILHDADHHDHGGLRRDPSALPRRARV